MAVDVSSELALRDILGVLRRRKGIIVFCILVIVSVAVVASLLQSSVYAAEAKVLLRPRSTESLFDSDTGQRSDPNRAVQTEIEVLESQPVQDAVRRQLGAAPSVTARSIGQTDVIAIQAESTIPKRAADVANAYATAYIDFRRQQAVDDVLAAAQQIQGKISDLQKQIDSLSGGAQKDSLIAQQSLFRQKLDELQVDAALKSGGAQLVAQAQVPADPVSPKPVRNAVLAAAVGLFLGTGLAFLIEYLDDSVKTKDDMARIAPSIPVIGLIPAVPGWKPTDAPQIVSLSDPQSPASEAYRTLRTSIQFLALERPVRTLQVTSPSAQEGKTTTLVNLGVALARAGQQVILVCCDLRRPRLHEFFGVDNSTGFTSVLLGKVPLSAALQPVRQQNRLSLLASGPIPPNPSELLASRRTVDVLTSLQSEADVVLIDSPPVLPVTDALVLSGRVDATLLVCVSGATTRKDSARAIELLSQVDAPLVGTVLNGVTGDAAYGYAYDYGYYRGDARGAPPVRAAGDNGQPVPAESAGGPSESANRR
ncbi:MAG TPA: polysaccharide biosynthesis tyrosine autokinase [Acidimicrobiales bacterium]|nr:polysaccharide biosynthesis tyrosine autokinase [Acidimicrobiales bacterium]